MTKSHFRLTAVKPLAGSSLRLTYADGEKLDVDLHSWIQTTQALEALKSADIFKLATLAEDGRSVEWMEGELDLAADNLRHLATEQSGGIGHERIWNWLHENGLTLEEGAAALGISRRMLIYYRDGEKPIPRAIWLACLGWEATRPAPGTLPRALPANRLS